MAAITPPTISGNFVIKIVGSHQLKNVDVLSVSDPFAEISLSKGDKNVLKTKTIDNNLNPQWNEIKMLNPTGLV